MKYKLGSDIENSLAYNVQDDELFMPEGYILCDCCDCCGCEKELYLKDRDVCRECYASETDFIYEIEKDKRL